MAITEIASAAAQAYSSQTGHGGGGLVAKSCPTLVIPMERLGEYFFFFCFLGDFV